MPGVGFAHTHTGREARPNNQEKPEGIGSLRGGAAILDVRGEFSLGPLSLCLKAPHICRTLPGERRPALLGPCDPPLPPLTACSRCGMLVVWCVARFLRY